MTNKPLIPAWLPWVAFGAVTLFLFREFVFSSAMLVGMDTEAMGYMARAFYAEELSRGNFPGWNPLLLGGTPFLASLAGGDSLYPPSLLLLLLMEPYRALGWKLVLHVFLAGAGMYGWTRALGASRAAGMVAGLGFLVAPFLVTLVYPGHDGKLFVTALTPFLFWAVERWFAGGRGMAWAGMAVTVALVTLTTHFQMAYFLFGATGAYAVFRAVQGYLAGRTDGDGADRGEDGEGPAGQAAAAATGAADGPDGATAESGTGMGARPTAPLGRFALFLAASLAGVALAGVQFLPAVEYITDFSRRTATTTQAAPEQNRAYASSWSLHAEEVMGLVVPEFVGNNANGADWARGTYWGRNPFKLNHEYFGLGILLLAGLAFVAGPRRGVRRFLLGLGLVALLYALGANTPVWGLFFGLLPGVSLFRAPSMAIFLTGFAFCTLAAFGVDRVLAWLREPESDDAVYGQRVLWVATGVLAVLVLLASGGGLFSAWDAVFGPDLQGGAGAARTTATPFVAQGAFVAALLAGALAGALALGRRGVLPATLVLATLVVLVTVDGARVDGAFIQTTDFREFRRPGPNITELLARQEREPPFRVLDLSEPSPGQGVRTAMHGLEIASGHHPNDLARYRELTGMVGSGMPMNIIESPNVMAILNVRYIVWPARQFGPAQGLEPVSATQFAGGELYEAVYAVDGLDRARLVSQVEVVPDEAAVERIMDPTFDVASTVTIPEALPEPLGGGVPRGSVEWVERSTDRQELRVETDRASLLVIADNWYPAWQARVDGEPVPLHRVNHTLRGIPVPEGAHTVELTFRSANVRNGLLLSGLGGLLVLGAAGTSLASRRRRASPAPDAGEPGSPAGS